MSDPRSLLERESRRFIQQDGAYERLLSRRDRKRRNQRIAAGVVGIAFFAAAVLILTNGEWFDRSQTPAAPSETNVSVAPPGEFAPDVPLTRYTSPQYGYSIAYPEVWSVAPATQPLTDLGLPIGSATDDFSVSPDEENYPELIIAAQPVEPGTTLHAWTSNVEMFVNQCGPPATRETMRVSGRKATLAQFPRCYYPGSKDTVTYWTTFIHAGMGYHVLWIGYLGDELRDRAVLDRVLKTFRFAD
jgi:hypothetical protein